MINPARWRLISHVAARTTLSNRTPVNIASGEHRGKVLAARDALITGHLHLVAPIARRIHKLTPATFDIEDLEGEGRLGLIRAAIRYQPKAHGGCPFSAFARPRIRGAIIDSIRRRHFTENTMPSIDQGTELDHAGPCLVDIRPLAPHAIDRSIEINTLRRALGALPEAQRQLLEDWYRDAPENKQRAGWRRRGQVQAGRLAAIANLQAEYRRAA